MRSENQILAQESASATGAAGQTLWAVTNNNGSVVDVVGNNGSGNAILDHIVYDSFGNTTSQTNSAFAMLMGFDGYIQDSVTGLYYANARFYSSQMGRFINQDPSGFSAGDSNLYRFVGNHPTYATDPTGLFEGGNASGASGIPTVTTYGSGTLDAVTGLHYEHFRNYSPSLGTWISQDPLSYVNGANTYQFVGGNPVGAVDASGAKQVHIPGVYYFKAYMTANPNGHFVHAFIEVAGHEYGFFPAAQGEGDWTLFKEGTWFVPGAVHGGDGYSNLPVGLANAKRKHSDEFLRKYSIWVDNCAVNAGAAAKDVAAQAAAGKANPPRYNYLLNNCSEWATSAINGGVWEAVYPGPYPHRYIQFRRADR